MLWPFQLKLLLLVVGLESSTKPSIRRAAPIYEEQLGVTSLMQFGKRFTTTHPQSEMYRLTSLFAKLARM